jgi:hypothetical protein
MHVSPLLEGPVCNFKADLPIVEWPMLLLLAVAFVLGLRKATDIVLRVMRHKKTADDFTFPKYLRSELIVPTPQPPQPPSCGLPGWRGQLALGYWKFSFFSIRLSTFLALGLSPVEHLQVLMLSMGRFIPWPEQSMSVGHSFFEQVIFDNFIEDRRGGTTLSYFPPTHKLTIVLVVGVFLVVVFGWWRFALVKPQPLGSPADDLTTLGLRLVFQWMAIPIFYVLLRPMDCMVHGLVASPYSFPLSVPVPASDCWEDPLGSGLYIFASVSVASLYWNVGHVVNIQLDCDKSYPRPTLWMSLEFAVWKHNCKLCISMVSKLQICQSLYP